MDQRTCKWLEMACLLRNAFPGAGHRPEGMQRRIQLVQPSRPVNNEDASTINGWLCAKSCTTYTLQEMDTMRR